jgi:hypothetical protein
VKAVAFYCDDPTIDPVASRVVERLLSATDCKVTQCDERFGEKFPTIAETQLRTLMCVSTADRKNKPRIRSAREYRICRIGLQRLARLGRGGPPRHGCSSASPHERPAVADRQRHACVRPARPRGQAPWDGLASNVALSPERTSARRRAFGQTDSLKARVVEGRER